MQSIRVETHENVISKNLIKGVSWEQSALASFKSNADKSNWRLYSIKQTGPDTVEVIRRRNFKIGFFDRMGLTSTQNVYQRVTIDRKERTTAVDHFNLNYFYKEPFVARRDLFLEQDEHALAYVRHDIWLFKLFKLQSRIGSSFQTWAFKK